MSVQRFLNLVAKRRPQLPEVPPGRRVYAIGDIHGRLDLIEALLDTITADHETRGAADPLIVFLGDLVDRGPDSCGVIERLIGFSKGPVDCRFLMGNHEEVFLRALTGDLRAFKFLLRIGGRATILSYGVSEAEYQGFDFEQLMAALQQRVPPEHVAFLGSFEETVAVGDYLFVHAGIRPGIELEAQKPSDLRWIREDFLDHRDSFGKMVVHGHSITEEVDLRANRIGIDTGAYQSGHLTAVGLEGTERWFLST